MRLMILFREAFFAAIDSKPSWGRDQIKELFLITLNNVLLGRIKDEEGD